ncbi:hypothetical protein HII13_002022 [Brettanomyces bruxellensis]|nr:hypothetical protein HII13_002022 [Brettanomyces bruxellensis]
MDVSELYNHDGKSSDESSESQIPHKRTTKEYKILYCYLMMKLRKAAGAAKKMEKEMHHSDMLIKVLNMRNNMIVDLLKYLDENEDLNPIYPCPYYKETQILERVSSSEEAVAPILRPIIDSISNDGTRDPSKLMDFVNKIKFSENLNYELYNLENSELPDMFNDSDFEELFSDIKRNRYYVHDHNRFVDPGEADLLALGSTVHVKQVTLKFTGGNKAKLATLCTDYYDKEEES